MASGLRAKMQKIVTSHATNETKESGLKRARCVTGDAKSGAKCSKGTKKEVVTSVGN